MQVVLDKVFTVTLDDLAETSDRWRLFVMRIDSWLQEIERRGSYEFYLSKIEFSILNTNIDTGVVTVEAKLPAEKIELPVPEENTIDSRSLREHAESVIRLMDVQIAMVEKRAAENNYDPAEAMLSTGAYVLAPLLEAKASAIHAIALLDASKPVQYVNVRNYPAR